MKYDVAIVGAGIVGLAHAWMAARRKMRVVVLERAEIACGASVRNFGMVWPIGQPAGERFETALRSRSLWLELHAAGAIQAEECGSIHLAHHDDEQRVLEEFCALGSYPVSMLTPHEVAERAPLANTTGLRAGLWSPTEMRVNPRVASAQIARWLAETQGVTFEFGTQIVNISDRTLHATDRRTWAAEQIVVCGGSDLQTLYPDLYRDSGLTLCKLQMLKFGVPAANRMLPHLASGLTLKHYPSFQGCPSFPQLAARFERDFSHLLKYGIHLMASQFPNGDIIFGDSHEYDAAVSPFDKAEIDEAMLAAGAEVFRISGLPIRERWHGIYAKNPLGSCFTAETEEGFRVFTGLGGAGMTMSFGLADKAWQQWQGE